MGEKVSYYAVILRADDRANPDGLARRRWSPECGIEDEMLRRDLIGER